MPKQTKRTGRPSKAQVTAREAKEAASKHKWYVKKAQLIAHYVDEYPQLASAANILQLLTRKD
jgi:hypothetical protein